MRLILFLCPVISLQLLISCTQQQQPIGAQDPVVILVSIDGFRHDYRDMTETPNLDALATRGTVADGLIPVFPSKTFPNHYSQVTGLYPEHHGIIANNMWDSLYNEKFFIGAGSAPSRDGKWYGGEPIWVTAEKQGRIAATYFWPGSDAEIMGTRPSHWRNFDSSVNFNDRVAQVVKWLELPQDQRPAFISLYFEHVDQAGHTYGPLAEQTHAQVREADKLIGKLLDGISDAGLEDFVNIIVVSDHGMTQLSRDSVIFIDDYVDNNAMTTLNWSPVADITPPAGQENAWYDTLRAAHPKMAVYRKGQVPEHLHYNDHRRIPPIIASAASGWSITTRTHFTRNQGAFTGATHGFEPQNREMHGLFIAAGPGIAEGKTVDAFENVHLYEMMCHLLDLTPAQNDGDLAVTREMLKN